MWQISPGRLSMAVFETHYRGMRHGEAEALSNKLEDSGQPTLVTGHQPSRVVDEGHWLEGQSLLIEPERSE